MRPNILAVFIVTGSRHTVSSLVDWCTDHPLCYSTHYCTVGSLIRRGLFENESREMRTASPLRRVGFSRSLSEINYLIGLDLFFSAAAALQGLDGKCPDISLDVAMTALVNS